MALATPQYALTFLFIAAPKLARTYNAFARKTTWRRGGPIYVVDPSGI